MIPAPTKEESLAMLKLGETTPGVVFRGYLQRCLDAAREQAGREYDDVVLRQCQGAAQALQALGGRMDNAREVLMQK